MSQVKQVKLEPAILNLFGGPQSEPFGNLLAEALDGSGHPASGVSFEWNVSSRELQIAPQFGNPSRARVGSYRPCSATVTVRESNSGLSASAKVTVNILDAGPPRPRSERSMFLSSVIESVRVAGESIGSFREGALPQGSGPAPRPAQFSLDASPGQHLLLELGFSQPAAELLIGASGVRGHFDLELPCESKLERLTLQLVLAERVDLKSVNLEFVARGADGFSEPSTPVYLEIERKES